ncbi:MAG TPA: PH domain-containing protein [Thermoplasmata archaeon]|nr:PH domain-containing protein [Thermoplasmata archaeon]
MQAAEQTILTLRPSRVLVLRYYVGMVLLLLATFALWFFNYLVPSVGPITTRNLSIGITAFFAFLIIVLALLAEFRRASTQYLVTDFRIIRKDGILRRTETVVPYRQLERVVLHQGILERILGIGSLIIDTGDDTVQINSIRDPRKVEQAIMTRMQVLQSMPGTR